MGRIFIFPILTVLLLLSYFGEASFVSAEDEDLWRDYESYEVIDHDTTWSGSFSQADIGKPVVVVNGATLSIAPGTQVSISELTLFDGRIVADGTESDPIIFTKPEPDFSSLQEDLLGYDRECFRSFFPSGTISLMDWAESAEEAPSVFRHVRFEGMGSYVRNDGANCPSVLGRGFIRYFVPSVFAIEPIVWESPVIEYRSGKVLFERGVFSGNAYADIDSELYLSDEWESFDELVVTDSDFQGNAQGVALRSVFAYDGESDHSFRILLRSNWYGDPSGPKSAGNLSGAGEEIFGPHTLDGWSAAPHSGRSLCSDCASNVLFFPGIKASKLYREGPFGTEDQLWPPNYFGDDIDELSLDSDGDSIESVYTSDVLESLPTGDLYQSFREDLDELKDEEVIADYGMFAYDWRQDVTDIVEHGTPYPDETTKFPLEEVRRLAASSKSGKVTIVAHSNGGLLAKAVMRALESSGDAGLVDTVVLVASPQMGTPLSILSLLYGYDESLLFGSLLSRSDARALVGNMPGAYGLLPSTEYFRRAESPVILFSSTRSRAAAFFDAYGEGIGDWSEFSRFLSGEEGREAPDQDDVDQESVLSKTILGTAEETHARIDDWTPPEGVRVVQIAGWGLETVAGIEYSEKERAQCHSMGGSAVPSCTGMGEYDSIYEPVFTVDGDKVVSAPSALFIPESDRVERYWVDLYAYNDAFLKTDRKHKDILEAAPVREFLRTLVRKERGSDLPEYFSSSRPDDYDKAASRLRMALYSPLDIHLYDEEGNHTGPRETDIGGHPATVVDEEIPGSSYFEFGERKYVSVPEGTPVRIAMEGYASGSYTFVLSEPDGTKTTFSHLPVSEGTSVSLEIPAAGIPGMSALRADMNSSASGGEYVVAPIVGGVATLPAVSASVSDGENDEEKKSEKKELTESVAIGAERFLVYSDPTNDPADRDWQGSEALDESVAGRAVSKSSISRPTGSGGWIVPALAGILVLFAILFVSFTDEIGNICRKIFKRKKV